MYRTRSKGIHFSIPMDNMDGSGLRQFCIKEYSVLEVAFALWILPSQFGIRLYHAMTENVFLTQGAHKPVARVRDR